jgi:protein-S-isoprenylcysteine O-methyltransferase Ste14
MDVFPSVHCQAAFVTEDDNPMSVESLFRIAFWLIFGGMIVMQVYFASRIRLAGEHKPADRKAIEREGWGYAIVRAVRSLSLIVFLMLYAINQPWLGVLSVPFPDWLRWMGVALGVLSLAFYAWSRTTLGKEWSSLLQMHDKHRLVTAGPYTWIRHPIYLALMGFLTGITFVTANWFLIAFLAVSIVDLALRIPKEEQMMIEEFGDEYKAYMQKTGRLFPR